MLTNIREAGRNTQGVKLVNLDEGDKLQAIAPVFVDPADGGTVRWVGGEEIADYLDIIAPAELMETAAHAAWDWLASPAAPDRSPGMAPCWTLGLSLDDR